MIIIGFRDVWHRILQFSGVAVVFSFSSLSLFAEGAPLNTGSSSCVVLPPGWTITQSQDDTPPPQAPSYGPGSSLDVNGTTLLLTAHPADLTRRAGISLFRANFHSISPPPLMSGEMGAQAEAEKLLCMVLGLGFTPTAIHTNRSNTLQSTPLLTIEVTGKNVAGEERVFTDTVAGRIQPIIRLFSSRVAADQTSADDINSIIHSFHGAEDRQGAVKTAQTGSEMYNSRASATPAGSSETSPQTAQMVSDYHDALLMVEGQNGVGSGFLCKLGEQTVAITNAHVISGNPGFKVTDLKSTVLNVTVGAVSVDHDIVRLKMDGAAKTFEVMDNLDANLKIGDPVVVLGNAEGARVVKPVEGKVVGIGPNLVEVDAPFVPGNSGSPIVHLATGKVVGVATYLIEKTVDAEGRKPIVVETRRFGYRLDSVKTWEPINWQRFYAQAAQLKKIEALSDDFDRLYKDSNKEKAFDPSDYQSPVIQRAVEAFTTPLKQHGRSISLADRKELVIRFLADLRNASHSDLAGFDARNSYDYFRRAVDKQVKFRDAVYDDLTRTIETKRF